MKINKKVTIYLSEENVKDIIAMYFKKEGYTLDINDVELVVDYRTVGYFKDERTEPYFKEAIIRTRDDASY